MTSPGSEEQPRDDGFTPVDYPAYLPDQTPPPPAYPPPVDPAAAYAPPPNYPLPPNYPPPQGYSPYYYPYGYPPPPQPGINRMAIGALVASVGGIVCCALSSVVGVVLGIIAMRDCRRTGQDGYGMALAATIIGGLVIAGTLAYIVLTLLLAI
jgi:hypothetical protein